MEDDARSRPNILVTGTPGTGKTTMCEMLAQQTGLTHINVGDLVKRENLHEGRDDAFDSFILDEDAVVDALEPRMSEGGMIVDLHSCDFFPERWFDLVVVLRSSTEVLYDRLKKRGYNEKKLSENMECEIMQVVLQEARESYATEMVVELQNDSLEQLESNVQRTQQWMQNWLANQQK